MVLFTIKSIATFLITGFFLVITVLIYYGMYNEKPSIIEFLPFIAIFCIVWLIFLGIFYSLWENEIKEQLEKKKLKRR